MALDIPEQTGTDPISEYCRERETGMKEQTVEWQQGRRRRQAAF